MKGHRRELEGAAELLDSIRRGGRAATIDESLAATVVSLPAPELRALARRAHRRGHRRALALVHGEFLARRGRRLDRAA